MSAQDHPLVSVIVPVYNVEQYLDCCLDSIRSQTWRALEIIVVEDCSTDDSLARLQPHLSDPRVRLIQHRVNSGLSAARNTGIAAASGAYVLFVDSDDAIAPTVVEACVATATAGDADAVVFDFEAFQDGQPLPAWGRDAGHRAQPLDQADYFSLPHFAWLKFIRRGLLDNRELRFPVGYYYEDWPFHWELGLVADSIMKLHGKWYGYRQRPASISASSGRKLLDQFAVQEMVLHRVVAHCNETGARVLAIKVHESFWTVLTRVDSELLPEAMARARQVRLELKQACPVPSLSGRSAVMAKVLALPARLAVVMVHIIRLARRGGSPLKGVGANTEPAT